MTDTATERPLEPANKHVNPDAAQVDVHWFGALAFVGALIGLGQLLASEEKLTWRIVVGRAMSSAALGASSTVMLIWWSDLPLFVLLGIACTFASLGTSGLERLVQIVFNKGR